MRKTTVFLALLIIVMASAACGNAEIVEQARYNDELPPSTGRIFLFGERHGSEATMARQLEIWGGFYHSYGMRHLFIENSYFGAQFLNMWMQADDDTILYQLFDDLRGTPQPYRSCILQAAEFYT